MKEGTNMNVVGTMFFKDNKLLIDKPRKRTTYQMIGGRVEDNETPLDAAIRETKKSLVLTFLRLTPLLLARHTATTA